MTLLSNERFSRSASTKTGLCLRLPNKTLHVLSCAWDPLSKAASRPLDMRLRTRVFPTRKETLRMADRVGQILGNYQLLRLLGRGAFAEVYLAEHRYLEVPAAIKVLHVRMESNTHEQFLREARTIAHLQHPPIVRVLDFGFQDQTPFLVMEYLPNGTLRTRYPTRRWLYWFYRSLVAGLVGGIIGVLAREFVGGLVEGLIIGLAIGMIVGLAGGLLGTRNTEIYSAEVAVWSWSQMWRRLINFLIAMLVFCLLFGLVIGLFNGVLIGLSAGLLGGVLGGLPRALFGGLSKKMLDEHDILRPNKGIWRAAWNAVRFV